MSSRAPVLAVGETQSWVSWDVWGVTDAAGSNGPFYLQVQVLAV